MSHEDDSMQHIIAKAKFAALHEFANAMEAMKGDRSKPFVVRLIGPSAATLARKYAQGRWNS